MNIKKGIFIILTIFPCVAWTNQFGLKFASYTYHAYDPDYDCTQYFDNDFIALGIPVTHSDSILIGTLNNSQDNRCFVAGVDHKWKDFGNGWSLGGSYLYVGEFFFDTFSSCGNDGAYKTMKDITGIGFAPYIIHYFEYAVTDNVAVDFGILLPGITIINASISF